MLSYWNLLSLAIGVIFGASAVLLYSQYTSSRIESAPSPMGAETRSADAVIHALDEALAAESEAAEQIAARFEAIDDLKTADELRLRRFRNADHLRRARSLGIGRVSGEDEIARLVDEQRLVRLEDTTAYYYLQEFDYSVPFVTPDAARLLALIGERLHEELRSADLPLFRFNISSVLRTAENQRALQRINPNATLGVSAHEFGTTLDIVVHIYDYVPRPEDALPRTTYPLLDDRLDHVRDRTYRALGMRYWRRLKGVLGRILIDLQNEGLVLVTLERQQPVFHITVARPIEESPRIEQSRRVEESS